MSKIDLNNSINHHLAISAVMIKRVFYKVLSNHKVDITPEQWVLLYHISEADGLTMGDLCTVSLKDFANTSRMVQKLEKAGYISKERDAIDKRIFKLYMSEAGKELMKQLHQCALESTAVALEGIDAAAQKILLKNFLQIIYNTNKYLDDNEAIIS